MIGHTQRKAERQDERWVSIVLVAPNDTVLASNQGWNHRVYRVPVFLSSRLNWVPVPTPTPRKRACLPPSTWVLGVSHTRWGEGGGGTQFGRQDRNSGPLYIRCTPFTVRAQNFFKIQKRVNWEKIGDLFASTSCVAHKYRLRVMWYTKKLTSNK